MDTKIKIFSTKTITWRIINIITLAVIAYIVLGNIGSTALWLFATQLTQTILYVIHEFAWHEYAMSHNHIKKRVILAKTISWRLIGYISYTIITYLFLMDIVKTLITIASVGIVYFILYYIHEYIWHNYTVRKLKRNKI